MEIFRIIQGWIFLLIVIRKTCSAGVVQQKDAPHQSRSWVEVARSAEQNIMKREAKSGEYSKNLGDELQQLTSISEQKRSKNVAETLETPSSSSVSKANGNKNQPELDAREMGGDNRRYNEESDQFLVIPVSYLEKELHINSIRELFAKPFLDDKQDEGNVDKDFVDVWDGRKNSGVNKDDKMNFTDQNNRMQELIQHVTAGIEEPNKSISPKPSTAITPNQYETTTTFPPTTPPEKKHAIVDVDFDQIAKDLKKLKLDLEDANIL